uniref:Uncharacterized protein n=1 Tax=Ciona savignyi TaxID=51511 RepID=H2Y9L3_CIOSA
MQTVQEQLEELQTENNRLMQENYKLRFGKDAPSHTSDYEYEAPDQSDEESRLLTTGADELAQNGAMEYSVKEVVQSSVESMVVSSQSVQGICPEDYEADVASSEEPDKQEYRKKRRSNKGRLSVTRATLQNGTTSDDEDTNVPGNGPTTLDDFSKIRTKNGGTNITAEVKCEKHTNGNFAEPEPNKEFDGINMDGCSGGEKFPATASMESLTSSDC